MICLTRYECDARKAVAVSNARLSEVILEEEERYQIQVAVHGDFTTNLYY